MYKTIINNFAFRSFVVVFTLLLISTYSSASNEWHAPVAFSLMIGSVLIALAYMIVHILKFESHKALVHDEAWQIATTALIVGVIILGAGWFDEILVKGMTGFVSANDFCYPLISDATQRDMRLPLCATLKDSTITGSNVRFWSLELNKRNQKVLDNSIQNTTLFINRVGEQSARSGMCSLLGIGYTIAGCSSWGVLRTPSSQLLNALSFATMDLQAEKILIDLIDKFALALILPIGVLLRALHFSRQAGSTLIALALSFYFIFPSMVIVGQTLSDAFILGTSDVIDASGYPKDHHVQYLVNTDGNYNPPDVASVECDPFYPEMSSLRENLYSFIKKDKWDSRPPFTVYPTTSYSERIMFFVLGRCALMTALSLTVTLAFTRSLGQSLGTDINVMSIARLS